MKRHFRTFVVAAATIAATTLQTIPAQACNKRGGGRVGVSIGRVGISVSRPPVYRTLHRPVHVQPHYVQPQPVFSQPIHPQPILTSQSAAMVSQQQPIQSNPVVTTARPAVAPVNASPAAGQPQVSAQSGGAAKTAEASALQMLASISTSDNSMPQNAAQIPEFTAASSATTTSHAGTWKVNLPGNQSVELVLDDNSGFRWTATKDGKSSSFQGQFRLENGRLTLVRSNDLQQMTGSWSGQGENFTFKLDGATTGGLAFVRS